MKVHCPHDRLVSVRELKPHPKNRNQHPKDQIERLAKILEYQGWRYPIKVSNRSGFITAGHGRLEAARHLKLKEVPVSFQDYTDEAQEYADLQADNAIASWSELDLSAINTDIGDLGPDFDIDLLGIKDFVIEPADKLDPQCDEDEVPEALPEPKVVRGEVFILGKHRLMCGDSTAITDVERLMDGKKADLLFTDPPYGIGYVGGSKKRTEIKNDGRSEKFGQFLNDVFATARAVLKAGAPIYACSPVDIEAGEFFKAWKETGWHYQACLVWVKNNASFTRFDYHTKHEFIHYGWQDGAAHTWEGDRKQDTVWLFNRPSKSELHPTMKPVELVEYALMNSSKTGSTVLDLFGGSGSTLIACEKIVRQCFMMELDPHYCGVILDRWQKFTGKKAIREDGKLWDELKVQ